MSATTPHPTPAVSGTPSPVLTATNTMEADDNKITSSGSTVNGDAVDNKRGLGSGSNSLNTATEEHVREASGYIEDEHANHPLAKLGNVRKHVLLLIFSIATFVDVCNVSGVAIAVAQIATDIKLQTSQTVWIITAYSLTFASFLLFSGRLSDLFPAQLVFEVGFILLGILSLVTSFVTTNKFGFLILRGLGGIAGSMTIPSAYHLIVHMFPNPQEKEKKLALLGMAGALGNVLGLVLAGLTMLASYHWFFRLMAIIALGFGILTVFLIPNTPSDHVADGVPRWRRLDIIGVIFMAGSLVCFIFALTQGPISGWGSADFIAPFIISLILAPLFFVWEGRIPPKSAILPATVWRITNMTLSSCVVLLPFAFWATSQLLFATYWQWVGNWSPIHVAAAMLPQGIAALIVGAMTQPFPQIINKPRYSVPIATVLIMIAEVLMYFSDGGLHNKDYWKYCFPAFVLGSMGACISYFGSGVNLVNYCPPEMGGVAGAWTQVLAQVGGSILLAIQAGLESPDLTNWRSNARSFWVLFALNAVAGLGYIFFFKEPAHAQEEHERARDRIRAVEEKFARRAEGRKEKASGNAV